MEPAIRIPEKNKKAGVRYAVTNDGVELPVIDVTHPAFELSVGAEDLAARREAFFALMERRARTPMFLRRLFLHLYVRRSVLMQGLMKASNRFLSGMNTYLLKIGPDNLGAGYTKSGDRQVAASYPVLAVRLRLQATARAIAAGFTGVLTSSPVADLHLINIAGGHAADSLNALILARRGNPLLLERRRIFIHILDLEHDAPDFGRRSLAAIQGAGAPLHGLNVTFSYVKYNWGDPVALRSFLEGLDPGEKVVALSSEGGLFEYGSDKDIVSNLSVFLEGTPSDTFIVGSVTRKAEDHWRVHGPSPIPIVHRGLPVFRALIKDSGWAIESAAEGPFSDVVTLKKDPPLPRASHME
jgi:hypothetical protein